MSVPMPSGGQEDDRANDTSPTRRFTEGDKLDTSRLRGGQLTASPGPVAPPIVSESADKDFNERMRNMTIAQESTPPALSPNHYDYSYNTPQYSPFTPTHQGPLDSQPAYPAYNRYPSQPGYQLRAPYLEHSSSDFSIATMHGMPGYPGQPPIARSMQSTSPQYSSQASITPRPYGWGSPPMSPAMNTVPFGGHFDNSNRYQGQGGYEQRGYGQGGQDDHSHMRAYQPPEQWVGPSSPYTHYPPHSNTYLQQSYAQQSYAQQSYTQQPYSQQHYPQHQPQPHSREHYPHRPAPALQAFSQHRGSWTGPDHRPPPTHLNRMSWSGQAGGDHKAKERKAYHPQPPARRSDWVMWVGNVPGNTSHEELWRYFNSTAPSLPEDSEENEWHGPSSIFLISRSQCAFVNLSSQTDLDRAVRFFNGKSLRPSDPRCPRMVCRVRRKDDDLRAGVGAQRGTGMHREWINKQSAPLENQSSVAEIKPTEPPSPAVLEQPPEGEGRRRESIAAANDARHESTNSMASTNSSFLIRHFPRRFFILKSLSTVELEDSVRSGTWKTQRHNEPVLDQAFRTAQEVILVFSANKSGEFFGYAKMVEPIDKVKAAARAAQASSKSNSSGSLSGGSHPPPPTTLQEDKIAEEDEAEGAPQRPQWLQTQSSHFAASSPGQLTPHEDDSQNLDVLRRLERRTESPRSTAMSSLGAKSTASAPAATMQRAQTLSPSALEEMDTVRPLQEPSFFDVVVPHSSREGEAAKQEALGGSSRAQNNEGDGVWRKDTVLSPDEKAERQGQLETKDEFSPEEWGTSFKIEWIRVGILPFHRIRSLRNPWNADREVKVSRDGTEIEPATAATLLTEWDRMGYGPNFPQFPEYRALT